MDTVRHMLEAGACAGVILLRRNCISPEQVERLTSALREAAGDLTPVISIDQEGGKVARLDSENGFLDWRSASEMTLMFYSDGDLSDYWAERARQLSDVGINLNFAPVVDLNRNPRNPIIGKLERSFGPDPAEVARYASVFIRAHHQAGVKTCLKHFPGHGSSISDSHREMVDISLSWQPEELAPFKDTVDAGLADSVMNAHLLHPDFSDAPMVPASLSRRSVDAIRTSLNFRGPIFTDDMQMAAVENAVPFEAAAIAAVSAGNTFLIYSNYRTTDGIDTAAHVLDALHSNAALLDPIALERQIADADAFRNALR